MKLTIVGEFKERPPLEDQVGTPVPWVRSMTNAPFESRGVKQMEVSIRRSFRLIADPNAIARFEIGQDDVEQNDRVALWSSTYQRWGRAEVLAVQAANCLSQAVYKSLPKPHLAV